MNRSLNQFMQAIQMAKQAYSRGEYAQAVKVCEQLATQVGPRDDLLNIKAVSLLALGQIEAAETAISQAMKLNPRVAGMHLNAAGIYKFLSRNKQVKRHAMNAVQLAPGDAMVLYQAALLCRDCGDYDQALRLIDRCLQHQPGFSQGWHLKGSALIDLGRTEEAQTALEKSLEFDAGNMRALSNLIKIRGDRLSNTETVTQLEHIHSRATSGVDRASAAFSLGNLYHRDGQYDAAFALYLKANALVATIKPFDADAWEQKMDHVIKASSAPDALTASHSNSGENLVFVIGMPRSGTTLCEQMLSTNPNVLACGELATVSNIENGFSRRKIDPFQNDLPAKELEQASALYLSALPKSHHSYQRVTDKAPMNLEHVGLIHRMFPQARFLYCIRHPLDTILSCFIQDFQAGLIFASNLEHITRVYIGHARLMQHWMTCLPGQIHTVSYEKYVANQETETRAIADFLCLDFEQGMMTPHLQKRAVVTASNLQVRKAVYSSSIGRWKNYQSHLTPVIASLQKEGLLDPELNA